MRTLEYLMKMRRITTKLQKLEQEKTALLPTQIRYLRKELEELTSVRVEPDPPLIGTRRIIPVKYGAAGTIRIPPWNCWSAEIMQRQIELNKKEMATRIGMDLIKGGSVRIWREYYGECLTTHAEVCTITPEPLPRNLEYEDRVARARIKEETGAEL